MSSVISEGTIHYGSYSEPSPGLFRRDHAAEEQVVVDLQDEQFPSVTELSEDEECDSGHEPDAGIAAESRAVSKESLISSKDHCNHSSIMNDSVRYSRELLVFYLYGRIKPRHGIQFVGDDCAWVIHYVGY